jgi:hypothetical protein
MSRDESNIHTPVEPTTASETKPPVIDIIKDKLWEQHDLPQSRFYVFVILLLILSSITIINIYLFFHIRK